MLALAVTVARADVPPIPPEAPVSRNDPRLPGVALAEGITQLTGVAISPLLGVSGVGAWEYFTTEASQRPNLPWFCHPAAWGIGFTILGLVMLKDVFGAGMPTVLKKPLDVIELFEDKISAVVASAALIPFLDHELAKVFAKGDEPLTLTGFAAAGFATIDPVLAQSPTLLLVLLVPLSLIAFFAVWLSSHALNVLLLFSPFGLLDLFLKTSRVLFIGFLALLSAVAPVLAAILCGVLILVALWFAPRTFRLCVFGTVMSTDLLRSLVRQSDRHEKTRGFLARRIGGLAALSFGRLEREDGEVVFSSRFLLLGPARRVALPASDRLDLEKGVIFPSIREDRGGSEKAAAVVHLLPRHRHDLVHVSEKLGIRRILDQAVVRGVKAAFTWVRESVTSQQSLPEGR
jgi:hypothetical protein